MNMVLVNYVSYYATQVRGFLKGLSQDTVEELTGGLEADLIEAMNESDAQKKTEDYTLDDLIARFGSPKAYAHELCESAGVVLVELDDQPMEESSGKPKRRSLFGKAKNAIGGPLGSVSRAITSTVSKPNVREILSDLKPVWWFLRAWLVYGAVVAVGSGSSQVPIPREFAYVLLLVVVFVISVWLGKRADRSHYTPKAQKWIVGLNVALLLLLPTVLVGDHRDDYFNSGYQRGWAEGRDQAEQVSSNFAQYQAGSPQPNLNAISLSGASNLFAYDSNGEFIPDVRIVDQSGNAISAAIFPVKLNRSTQEIMLMNVREDEFGRSVENVFPASFTAVDLENDTCSQSDHKFWRDILMGFVSEQWDSEYLQDESPEPGQYVGETGRLQSGGRYADFKYGANDRELYVGGKSTLSGDSNCILGFKRSVLNSTEKPQIMTLPSLAPMPDPSEKAQAEGESAADDPQSSSSGDAGEAGNEGDKGSAKGGAKKEGASEGTGSGASEDNASSEASSAAGNEASDGAKD